MFLDPHLLKRCLFIDIETVSEYESFQKLPDEKKELWMLKCHQLQKYNSSGTEETNFDALYESRAGIFAEFAKVVSISMGFLTIDDDIPTKIRLKSLAGDEESRILNDFSKVLANHYNDPDNSRLCGHNIKEFDIPFLCRRMVINQIKFPPILDISGKKPWQTSHIMDTMDMWRFGDYKNYTSLNLLAATLGIISPKDDIDGSMVGHIYWKEGDIDRIVTYCQKDVVTVIQIVMKYAGLPLFSDDDIEYLNQKQ
ncbi:MAG: ribonuclease H-like domain-containing protein [Saprospiraceae bacterium]|nr:ribonuclease H-like domain-containing protein [Saprospiraceae bacterium]